MIDYNRIQRIYNELEQPGFINSVKSIFASESHLISRFKSFAANATQPSVYRGNNLTFQDTYNLVYILCQFNQDKEYDRLMAVFKAHLTEAEYVFINLIVSPCTAHFYQSRFTLEKFKAEVDSYMQINEKEVRITLS